MGQESLLRDLDVPFAEIVERSAGSLDVLEGTQHSHSLRAASSLRVGRESLRGEPPLSAGPEERLLLQLLPSSGASSST